MTEKTEGYNEERKRAYIGKRCKIIRNELGLTQEYFVTELGAENQASISNLENKGMIGEFLWVYLEFFYSKGYNPLWIIIKDNSKIPKKQAKTHGIRYYKDELARLQSVMTKIIESSVVIQDGLSELANISPLPNEPIKE